jgi:hypothetical protein
MRHAGRQPAWQHHLQTRTPRLVGADLLALRGGFTPVAGTRPPAALAAELDQEPPHAPQKRSEDLHPKARHAAPTALGY